MGKSIIKEKSMSKRIRIIALMTVFMFIGVSMNLFAQQKAQAEAKKKSTVKTSIKPKRKVITMDNGLVIEIVKEGATVACKKGDLVRVHYTGTFMDGKKFDSSLDRNQPFDFKLGAGMVIKGWDLGVEGMKLGEKRILTIPSDLAYGDRGAGGVIPPKATLKFEVELIAINPR